MFRVFLSDLVYHELELFDGMVAFIVLVHDVFGYDQGVLRLGVLPAIVVSRREGGLLYLVYSFVLGVEFSRGHVNFGRRGLQALVFGDFFRGFR